jgi:hypothetical protein
MNNKSWPAAVIGISVVIGILSVGYALGFIVASAGQQAVAPTNDCPYGSFPGNSGECVQAPVAPNKH